MARTATRVARDGELHMGPVVGAMNAATGELIKSATADVQWRATIVQLEWKAGWWGRKALKSFDDVG